MKAWNKQHIISLLLNSFLMLCFVILNGCAKEPSAEINGKAQFNGYGCNTCHRIGNKGGTLGPDLTYIGFRKSPEWLDLWLKNPHAWKPNTSMPNFYLKENVRKELVKYLSSLKGQDYQNNPPWNDPSITHPIQKGKVIFERVGCVGCHGIEGKGGYPNNNVVGGKIPSLTLVADGYSKDELIEKLNKGVPHPQKAVSSEPDPMIFMPSWGEILQKEELDALADYLISLCPARTGADAWE